MSFNDKKKSARSFSLMEQQYVNSRNTEISFPNNYYNLYIQLKPADLVPAISLQKQAVKGLRMIWEHRRRHLVVNVPTSPGMPLLSSHVNI